MTAAEKIDLILENCPQVMLDNEDFELHISPMIYWELKAQNEKLIGGGILDKYRGYPLKVKGQAPKDWILATMKDYQ